jgi:anti-sigma regulatory factor (Ser/Thr protein kinase)
VGAGLSEERSADLELAVHELAANSIRHGGGLGQFALWREGQVLVCEVHDGGRCADPLVGRRTPSLHQSAGRGLWMVNQLCDLVQLRSGDLGTTVRLHIWL